MDYAGAERDSKMKVESKYHHKKDHYQPAIDSISKELREKSCQLNIGFLIEELSKLDPRLIVNKCEPYFPYNRYNKEKGLSGPQNIIGFIAYILGYPEKEIAGKSIYGHIQDKTGWSLAFLTELGDLGHPRTVLFKIQESLEND